MKLIYKSSSILFIALALAGISMIGCSDEEGGAPLIRYIRITNPSSSDSLLVAAGQGQMIAIVGENLGSASELWINDQQAVLNPSFITNTTIITRVPSRIPTEVNDKIIITFSNGQSLEHDFSVDISEPEIDYMKSEYVNAGEIAVINGNYFYEPVAVFFVGDVQGEIVDVTATQIQVRVPEGAQPGPVAVATNFGIAQSTFWFRDNRNRIASFDIATDGWWHGQQYLTTADDEIVGIDGNYLRIQQSVGVWGWLEFYAGPKTGNIALESKNIPAEAFASPENYELKFELNTLKSLTGAQIRMYFGNGEMSERDNNYYIWEPNIHTEGQWETVTIPWADVYASNKEFAFSPDGYNVSVHFNGPLAVDLDLGMDNLRVVAKPTE